MAIEQTTFEQIEKLIGMGFTPEQITQLTISSVNPTPTEETTGPEGEASAGHPLSETPSDPLPETPTAPIPETAPETPEIKEDANTEVLAAIADLKKAVQANNIKTMSVDGVDPEAELEAAMSELIRPSLKKGE